VLVTWLNCTTSEPDHWTTKILLQQFPTLLLFLIVIWTITCWIFGNGIFWLVTWSAQSSILTEVTIMFIGYQGKSRGPWSAQTGYGTLVSQSSASCHSHELRLPHQNKVGIYSANLMAVFGLLQKEKMVEILIKKGIPLNLVQLIHSFFDKRSGFFQVIEARSCVRHFRAGCVQGSILGPILFNIRICIVNGFMWTNSFPENQSVCLNLWVSIPLVIMKSQSNMEIFYYLGNKDCTLQKQQVNKQQRAWSQSGRQHMVNLWTWQGLNLITW